MKKLKMFLVCLVMSSHMLLGVYNCEVDQSYECCRYIHEFKYLVNLYIDSSTADFMRAEHIIQRCNQFFLQIKTQELREELYHNMEKILNSQGLSFQLLEQLSKKTLLCYVRELKDLTDSIKNIKYSDELYAQQDNNFGEDKVVSLQSNRADNFNNSDRKNIDFTSNFYNKDIQSQSGSSKINIASKKEQSSNNKVNRGTSSSSAAIAIINKNVSKAFESEKEFVAESPNSSIGVGSQNNIEEEQFLVMPNLLDYRFDKGLLYSDFEENDLLFEDVYKKN